MRGDWVNMQSLTDRRKDKQICMHDREIGRQMEGGKDRNKFTDITGVGLCQRACVDSRCECTRACARRWGGGLRTREWRIVIWYTEKPSCAETGHSDGLSYITQTRTHARPCTHRLAWALKERNCHDGQRSAGLAHVSSRCNWSFEPPLWCPGFFLAKKSAFNKAVQHLPLTRFSHSSLYLRCHVPWNGRHRARWRSGQSECRAGTFRPRSLAAICPGWK